MKKTSTAAAKTSRNISRQRLTIGLDLGDRNSWYRVVDEAGGTQREQRVRTTAKALQEAFGGMPRSRIALDQTVSAGAKFGRWRVEETCPRLCGPAKHALCVCECGTRRVIGTRYLLEARSLSCGCLKIDRRRKRLSIAETAREWRRIWKLKRLGFVEVCEEWRKFQGFLKGFATARPQFDPVRRGGAIQRNKLRLGHTALANLIVYVAFRAAQVPDADDS